MVWNLRVFAVVVAVFCIIGHWNCGPRLSLYAAEDVRRDTELHVAPFVAEITPSIGGPIGGGLSPPVASVEHPLMAKGIVLQDGGETYVLCAFDLCAVVGETYQRLCAALAEAAGTRASHVAVHTLHQHTANTLDMDSQRLVEDYPGIPTITTEAYVQRVVSNTGDAVRRAMREFRPFTHVGTNRVKVERVASSRRLRQADGSIIARMSATRESRLQQLPEGRIDPWLRTIAFYDGQTPVAFLHYYATHPQSFYNDGRVTYDVPGIARERLESETGVPQIYFTGCAGDIAMGKYNDGSVEARAELADRLHDAMVKSVAGVSLQPVSRIGFSSNSVQFSARQDGEFAEAAVRQRVPDKEASNAARIKAASILAWIERSPSERAIRVSCLSIGPARLLNLPGEAFVDYQLWAQQVCPDDFVAVAAYGDCGMWYIPTDRAYNDKGGYEQTWAFAAPLEGPLKNALAELLDAPSAATTRAEAAAAAPESLQQ